LECVKEAHLDVNGLNIGVAVVNGLGNAKKLLEAIRSGEKNDLHFVEVMTCPGGCVGGGGQPYGTTREKILSRAQTLYHIDACETLRVSHKNPELKQLYDEFLGTPNGEKSHELLHTFYHEREVLL
jgi:iron only hydrogenase large subunit-like protein